jgi:exodeoxyribonuclease VII large subunit
MTQHLLSVTELNEYMRMLLESDPLLGSVFVRGEISNFTNHYKMGHFYFSIKDEGALVRAVMFRSNAQKLRFLPENGMKVILHGRVSVFPRDGQYQIYVDDIQPDGVGALYLAFEQLRQKLEAEGLFAASRKRPIPRFPQRIGVITAPTGAAVRDILHILGRRWPLAEVILYPALVQGAGAPETLIAGLECFHEKHPVDVIILGRGGGSAEDLFAFNHEGLARAIAASRIPVISAVGHETDFSISDFVADLRAPTPSAAAELAVPDRAEIRDALLSTAHALDERINTLLTRCRADLDRLSGTPLLRSPQSYLDERRMSVAYLEQRAQAAFSEQTARARTTFAALCAKMEALSPLRVLSRGYTAVFDREGKPVTAGKQLAVGECVRIRFCDSTVDATVSGVRESE